MRFLPAVVNKKIVLFEKWVKKSFGKLLTAETFFGRMGK